MARNANPFCSGSRRVLLPKRFRSGSAVHGVVRRNGPEKNLRVPDRLRKRTYLVKGWGERHKSATGNRPVGGLHPHDAAERGGLTDPTARVPAPRPEREASPHAGGGA